MLPPKTSLSLVGASRQKVHGGGLVYLNKRFRSASTSRQAVLDEFAIGVSLSARDGDAGALVTAGAGLAPVGHRRTSHGHGC